MEKISLLIVAIFIPLLNFLIAPKVTAGGGLVSFEVSPLGILSPGEQFIVKPTVYVDNSYEILCKNCPVEIKLADPQEDDYIALSSTKTDELGTVNAKIVSYTFGKRVLYAEVVLPDGALYTSSSYILNYQEAKISPVEELEEITPTEILATTSGLIATISGMATESATASPIIFIGDKLERMDKQIREIKIQLKESQKREDVLEKRLSEIMGWIKRAFPDFGK